MMAGPTAFPSLQNRQPIATCEFLLTESILWFSKYIDHTFNDHYSECLAVKGLMSCMELPEDQPPDV